jgi:tRNA dimethylallyltransferase
MLNTVEHPPIVITGPTASGKGAVAFEVARQTGGEILSLDSMKVYREIDIATAKPPAERRSQVPYHLIDIVDPDVDFSTGDYLPLLERALEDVRSRGKLAVITGGTALYLKVYLDGFQAGPQADWGLRKRFLEEAKEAGPESLHDRLRQLDAGAARKIHPGDVRRIVRALEVVEKTGHPLSEEWGWEKRPKGSSPVSVFALERDRAELYERIDRRVEAMFERGLLQEALRLKDRNPPLSRSAAQSIGYKEVCQGVLLGRSREEIVAQVKQRTRQFAKRQLTWFRKMPIQWVPVRGDAGEVAGELVKRLGDG